MQSPPPPRRRGGSSCYASEGRGLIVPDGGASSLAQVVGNCLLGGIRLRRGTLMAPARYLGPFLEPWEKRLEGTPNFLEFFSEGGGNRTPYDTPKTQAKSRVR